MCIFYSPFRTIEYSGGMYKNNSALTFRLDRGIPYTILMEIELSRFIVFDYKQTVVLSVNICFQKNNRQSVMCMWSS